MSDIWCYKMDCFNNGGFSGKDKNGEFGTCLARDIIVDRNVKCDSYENSERTLWERQNLKK